MRLARLTFKEAQEYSDVISIQHDLRTVIDFCDYILAAEQPKTLEENLVLEGLSHAAVMRYCRAFSPGSRSHLDRNILQNLPAKQIVDHEFFKALRDKYIAHSVNSFEESSIYAQIKIISDKEFEIPNVQSRYLWMKFLKPHETLNLKNLASAVLVGVQVLADSKQKTVLEMARKMSIQQLELSDMKEISINVSRDAVSKRRK